MAKVMAITHQISGGNGQIFWPLFKSNPNGI